MFSIFLFFGGGEGGIIKKNGKKNYKTEHVLSKNMFMDCCHCGRLIATSDSSEGCSVSAIWLVCVKPCNSGLPDGSF